MSTHDTDTRWRERPAAAAYAAHFLFGIVMALLGAILPTLSARIGFDLAQAGRLFLVMNACLLLSSFALGPAMDRFGMKPPLVAGSLLTGTGLALVALAPDYASLAWGTAVLGLGGGALNTGGNTLVADLHGAQESRSAALNRLGVFFGIGALAIPLAIGLLLEVAELASILLASAGLCVAAAAFIASVSLPAPKRERHVPVAEVARLAREPFVLLFAALLFLQSGNEFVAGGYAASFLVRETGLSAQEASWGLAAFWGSLLLARVALGRVALRVNGPRLLILCALASAAAAALLALSRHPALAVLAVVCLGASLAGIFPTALGIVGARYPGFTGTVFGLLIAAGLSGGMFLPWLTGLVGESHGLRPALALVAAQFLGVAALAAQAGRPDYNRSGGV
jgi:fucose permease